MRKKKTIAKLLEEHTLKVDKMVSIPYFYGCLSDPGAVAAVVQSIKKSCPTLRLVDDDFFEKRKIKARQGRP